jgi:hypothetical protein
MNEVIKVIDKANSCQEVLISDRFDFDKDSFMKVIDGPVYGKRFTKYILLKLDFLFHNHDHKMQFETLSVEHILPQNPDNNSQWVKDFTQTQREEWTHKLGNLVLITRRKNAAQGRKDYLEKVNGYFKKNIDTCPNSLRVLTNYSKWTLTELQDNHAIVIQKIKMHYEI